MGTKNKYVFSPSIIKDFINYVEEVGYEKDDVLIPFVTEEKLLNRINRVPESTNEAAKKGMDFESILLGDTPKYGFTFNMELVEKMKAYLPKHYLKQVWVEANLEDVNCVVGGYCDIVCGGKIIDIKTSSTYNFPDYLNSPQLLYLKALKDKGVYSMEFLITNFSEVFKEDYHISNLDFSTLYNYIERLQLFVNANSSKIFNLKVFGREEEMPWMSETLYHNLYRMSRGLEEDKNYVKAEMVKYRMKTIYRQGLIDALF